MAAEETQPSKGDVSQDADPFMKLGDAYGGQTVHKKTLSEILDHFGDIVDILKEEEPQYRRGLLHVLGLSLSGLATKFEEDISRHFVKARTQAKTSESATSMTATTAVDDEDDVDEEPIRTKSTRHTRSAGKADEPDTGSRRSVKVSIPILGDDTALSSEEDLDDDGYPSRKKTARENTNPAPTDPSTPKKQKALLLPIPPTPFTTRKPGVLTTKLAYQNIYNELIGETYDKWQPGSKKNKKSNVFDRKELFNMMKIFNTAVSSDDLVHHVQQIVKEANTVNKDSSSAAGTAVFVRKYISNHEVEGELGSFLDQYAKVEALTADKRPAYDYMLSSYECMKFGMLYQNLRSLIKEKKGPGPAIRQRINTALTQVAHRPADLRGTTRTETIIKTYLALISDSSGHAYDSSRAQEWKKSVDTVGDRVNEAKSLNMLTQILGEGSAVFVTKGFVRAMRDGIYKWQTFLTKFTTHIPEVKKLADDLNMIILGPCVAGKAPRRDLLSLTSQEPICDRFRSARARIEEVEDENEGPGDNLAGGIVNDQDNDGNNNEGERYQTESEPEGGEDGEGGVEEEVTKDAEEDVGKDAGEEFEETSGSGSGSESEN